MDRAEKRRRARLARKVRSGAEQAGQGAECKVLGSQAGASIFRASEAPVAASALTDEDRALIFAAMWHLADDFGPGRTIAIEVDGVRFTRPASFAPEALFLMRDNSHH